MGQGGNRAKGFVPPGGPGAPGAEDFIRYAIGVGATQDSASSIPAGARVVETVVEVVTPFSAGATIEVGRAGSLALLEATTDNNPLAAGLYAVPGDVDWGGAALPVRTTVGGAPAAGAGFVLVHFAEPLP
jgi:hypothetical protein